MQSTSILGVKIDKVNLKEATRIVDSWLNHPPSAIRHPRYIVTPNIEFILQAQQDLEFRQILNSADLSIPDSSHLGWANQMANSQNIVARLLLLPLFLLPNSFFRFPKATGIDLMEQLCRLAAEKGYCIGLLGGKNNTAKKAAMILQKKYPNLNISFAENGGEINEYGVGSIEYSGKNQKTKNTNSLHTPYDIPHTDILFVAFGHGKQEKWIQNQKDRIPAKVFMGVGGSFDYIAGTVARAPQIIQNLGLEWLFRLIIEPWRMKRQFGLLRFIILLFLHRS